MTPTDAHIELPRIISVDDHVIEPPNLWSDRLPARLRERGPRVVSKHGVLVRDDKGQHIEESDAPNARWGEEWVYDGDVVSVNMVGNVNIEHIREAKRQSQELILFEEMPLGCYDQAARLEAMDRNHTDASICFPTMPRFCGQTFLERGDHSFALECLRIYNDWMIDEWCGGAGRGRLLPLTVVPLWDADLAAQEVYRCAGKGSFAIAFAEGTDNLNLPSIYTGYWDPLLQACQDTDTVINMHIGSSSSLPKTSRDAPLTATVVITFENALHAAVDWVLSGVLVRYPGLKIVLSEGQGGWLPFIYERFDDVWHRGEMYEYDLRDRLPEPPSALMRDRVFTCIFNDEFALKNRDVIGLQHLLFEIDYPHSDSTYPASAAAVENLVTAAGLTRDETWQFLRGNAIDVFGLQRFGIST